MKKAAPLAFLQKRKRVEKEKAEEIDDIDLNIFVVTFNGMKEAEKNIAGGDPYQCEKCKAILNKFSKILSPK